MVGHLVAATGLQAMRSVGNEHTVGTKHIMSLIKTITLLGISGTANFFAHLFKYETDKPSYPTSQQSFQIRSH